MPTAQPQALGGFPASEKKAKQITGLIHQGNILTQNNSSIFQIKGEQPSVFGRIRRKPQGAAGRTPREEGSARR